MHRKFQVGRLPLETGQFWWSWFCWSTRNWVGGRTRWKETNKGRASMGCRMGWGGKAWGGYKIKKENLIARRKLAFGVCSFLASRCQAVERGSSQTLSQPKSKGNFIDPSGDLKTQIKKCFQLDRFSLKHLNRSNIKENIFRNWCEEINS